MSKMTRGNRSGTGKRASTSRGSASIIFILTTAGSHPDCRAVLIQIVARYASVVLNKIEPVTLRWSEQYCKGLSAPPSSETNFGHRRFIHRLHKTYMF